MSASIPHYHLFSESIDDPGNSRWRFVLRSADGVDHLEADEAETGFHGERLELLAVVRGLEALDQPSHVTLVTSSAYLREGIRNSLPEWRKNGWCWEFYGQMVPVKNADLWKRVNQAMNYHTVECRSRNWRFDPPHLSPRPVEAVAASRAEVVAAQPAERDDSGQPAPPLVVEPERGECMGWPASFAACWMRWKRRIGDRLSALVASPRFG